MPRDVSVGKFTLLMLCVAGIYIAHAARCLCMIYIAHAVFLKE